MRLKDPQLLCSRALIGGQWLAGEATHETLWGTVDGAWESGERAADAALQKIGALRPSCRRASASKHSRAMVAVRSVHPLRTQ